MKRVTEVPRPPERPADAHKGTAGLVLVVAGSRGMAGAAALTGNAALRGGAGLVKIATPDDALDTVACLAPCCTTASLPVGAGSKAVGREHARMVLELAQGQDAIAMGPGLGQAASVGVLVRGVLAETAIPVVLDADGLNAIADGAAAALGAAKAPVVITPHPGEAARLLGCTASEVQGDREASAARLAELAPVAVLKGSATVVSDGERLYVNDTGNPGLATAGSGDVLTGLVAALVAGGMGPFEASVLGVWAHGRAGDVAAERTGVLGLTALDVLGCLAAVLKV